MATSPVGMMDTGVHFYKCQVNSAHGVENIDKVMKISSSCDR